MSADTVRSSLIDDAFSVIIFSFFDVNIYGVKIMEKIQLAKKKFHTQCPPNYFFTIGQLPTISISLTCCKIVSLRKVMMGIRACLPRGLRWSKTKLPML